MGLRVWAVWMHTAVRARRAVVAWLNRPVDPRPLLARYGKHDARRVGEDTVPLAVLLAQFEGARRPVREPRLFGTAPLHLWTHPERYGKPTPPPAAAVTALFSPDFDDTEVMA